MTRRWSRSFGPSIKPNSAGWRVGPLIVKCTTKNPSARGSTCRTERPDVTVALDLQAVVPSAIWTSVTLFPPHAQPMNEGADHESKVPRCGEPNVAFNAV